MKMSAQVTTRSKDESRLSGWRRLAVFNITLLGIFTIVFIGFIIAASIRLNGIRGPIIFYTGDCKAGSGASRVSTGLHLVINIAASCILASSNYFMQVLNAPSRAEIDRSHARGKALEIGYPAWGNAFKVSRAKTIAWAVLLLSSVPIHLLFNSTIFETDYRERDFQLTIASEGFVDGAQYFFPGASLAVFSSVDSYGYIDGSFSSSSGGKGTISSYLENSENAKNITYAAANGARWSKLEPTSCAKLYATCRGLTEYSNVVVVVDGVDGASDGWTRDEVWDLSANDEAGWDDEFPPTERNSLWYSAGCTMDTQPSSDSRMSCENNCVAALGTEAVSSESFVPPENWTIDFFRAKGPKYELKNDQGSLPVKYCLAEPITHSCSVGFSNILLVIVTVCVLVKTVTCVIVFMLLRHTRSLVTLGDAIEEFIVSPDEQTRDCSLLAGAMVRSDSKAGLPGGPIEWHNKICRGFATVPWKSCWYNFTILFVGFAGSTVVVIMFASWNSLYVNPLFGTGEFCEYLNTNSCTYRSNISLNGDSHDTDFGTNDLRESIPMMIAANVPQLVLSFWYLSFNTLLTRWHMAKEWALFFVSHRPLRVTSPK